MWWFTVLVIVGIIIYKINKDYKEHVETHITRFGGMRKKYNLIVDYLLSNGLSIQKETKDGLVFSSNSMTWMIDQVGYNLEIRLKGFMPFLGNYSKKWIFPSGYPQEKIIEEFENYSQWQMTQFIELMKDHDDNYKYID